MGRRLSFERCEPRTLLSATSANFAVRDLTALGAGDADQFWQNFDRDELLEEVRFATPAVINAGDLATFYNAAAHEGGLVTSDRYWLSVDSPSIAWNRNYVVQLGSTGFPHASESFDSTLSSAYTPIFVGGDSDGGVTGKVFDEVDLGDLDAGDVDSDLGTWSGPSGPTGSSQDAIYLAMRPSMQPIATPVSTSVESEGGAVATPLRRTSLVAFASLDGEGEKSASELASTWKVRDSLPGVDDERDADKMRARAVALEVGGDGALESADWRAAALARDAAFREFAEGRKTAKPQGENAAEARELDHERNARRTSRDTAKDAAEQIPAEDAAQADQRPDGQTKESREAANRTGEVGPDVTQGPVGASRDEQASTTRSAALETDEPRQRMAAGLAALLIGGTVALRRRKTAEPTATAQHPPRRRG